MQSPNIERYFLFALLVASSIGMILIVRPFIIPLALAAVFAVALHPLYANFLKFFRRQRALAGIATIVIALACIILPLWFITMQLLQESQRLYGSLASGAYDQPIQTLTTYVGNAVAPFYPEAPALARDVSAETSGTVRQGVIWILEHSTTVVTNVVSWMLATIIFLVALFYFFVEGPAIRRAILRFSPLRDTYNKKIMDRMTLATASMIRGSVLIAIIQGILATGGYLVAGIPNPFLWGVLTSVAAIIPNVGTGVVILPAVAYLFIVGQTIPAIGLLLWGVLVVGLIDNVLKPILIGRGADLHPFLVFICILGGIAFFGPAGVFLAPVILSFFLAVFGVYAELETPDA